MKQMLLVCCLILAGWGRGWAQAGSSVDSLLPPDHILEDIPWLGDDGKIEQKGLFSFEDLRAPDSKDLVLLYRASDAAQDLGQPHAQTLVICFYNPTQKKYEKAYSEDGGQVQWIKVAEDAPSKRSFLFVDRLDGSGQQVLSGYACSQTGVQSVLQAQAPQVYAQFDGGVKGLSVLCSDKAVPQSEKDAEHVFKWNDGKALFAEAPSTPAAGWVGSSVAGAAVTLAAAPAASPAPTAAPSPAAAAPAPTAVAAVPASASPAAPGDWWGTPLDAAAASAKLDNAMVPEAVKSGRMADLGKKAAAFFQKAKASGVSEGDIAKMRSTYYASVASSLSDMGRAKDAVYYLNLALRLDPSDAQALGLKSKLKP